MRRCRARSQALWTRLRNRRILMAVTNGSGGQPAAAGPAGEGAAAPAGNEGTLRAARTRTPVNFLRATRRRQRDDAAVPKEGARSEGSTPNKKFAPPAAPARPDAGAESWAIPDSVRDRFTQDGR